MREEYELLVIGGGIIGASCAYESALRGVKTLLLDKADFGSKTSQGSFKIVHGGLRYLQHFDYPRLRESVRSQNYIRRFAPHLVQTLPFIVPCYGFGMKGKEILSLACELYNLLSIDRNRGVSSDQILPRYKVLSLDELVQIAPHVERAGLRGGVVFFDSQMLDPDRLTLQFILSAEREGAYCKNYKEVVKIVSTEDGYKVEVRDVLSGILKEVKTKYIVNAMGPWASGIAKMFGGEHRLHGEQIYSKGIQIGLRDFPVSNAISIQTKGTDTSATLNRGGRAIFMQPWREYTLLGTTDTIYKGSPDGFSIGQDEIRSFFNEVKCAYPDPRLKEENIVFSFGGLRPIDPALKEGILRGECRDGLVNTSRDEDLIDHDNEFSDWGMSGQRNLVSIIGIKYTTCRSVAIRVMDLLSKKGLTTQNRGADYFNYNKTIQASEVQNEIRGSLTLKNPKFQYDSVVKEIWETYGEKSGEFLSHVNISDAKESSEVTHIVEKAMILNAVSNEYARTIQDVVVRRLSRKLFSPNNILFIDKVREVYRNELGWDEDKISSEISEIKKTFPI